MDSIAIPFSGSGSYTDKDATFHTLVELSVVGTRSVCVFEITDTRSGTIAYQIYGKSHPNSNWYLLGDNIGFHSKNTFELVFATNYVSGGRKTVAFFLFNGIQRLRIDAQSVGGDLTNNFNLNGLVRTGDFQYG